MVKGRRIHARAAGRNVAWAAAVFAFVLLTPAARVLAEIDWEHNGATDIPTADFAAEIDFFKVESDIVTSVSRHPESQWKSAGAVYVVTGEAIRKAGVESLVDALRMVPGLDVAAVDRNFYAVSARGLNNTFADKMLVLLDGRPIYTPLFGGTLWHQWETFLADIERIEIIRGPGGTLWGANAMNGVINIITKSSEDTHGVLARVAAGGNYRGLADLRYGGHNGGLNYRVSARYNADEGFGGSGGDRVADDNQEVRAGYRMDWDLGHGLMVRGSTEFSDSRIGNEGHEVGTGQILFPGPKYETQMVTGVWRAEKDFADGSSAHLQIAGDYIARETPFLGVIPGDGSFRSFRRTWEVELQHSLRLFERHRITWGGQFRYTNVDAGTGVVTIGIDRSNDGLNVFGLFAQDEIDLPLDLKLTIGSKIENNTFTGTNLQPSVRLAGHTRDGTVLWGSISRAVNTPSFGDETVSFSFPPDTTTIPGMTILPVFAADGTVDDTTLLAYEMGIRHRFNKHASIDVATFYNDYDGVVSYSGNTQRTTPIDPTTLLVETFLDNTWNAYGYGIEAVADLIAGERLRGQLNLTWQRTSLAGTRNPSSPAWKVNFRCEARPLPTLTLVPTIHWVDDVRIPSIFGPAVPAQNAGDYLRVDLAAHWRPRPDWPTLSLIGQNLTDHRHIEFSEPIVRMPSPVTRTWLVRVEYRR